MYLSCFPYRWASCWHPADGRKNLRELLHLTRHCGDDCIHCESEPLEQWSAAECEAKDVYALGFLEGSSLDELRRAAAVRADNGNLILGALMPGDQLDLELSRGGASLGATADATFDANLGIVTHTSMEAERMLCALKYTAHGRGVGIQSDLREAGKMDRGQTAVAATPATWQAARRSVGELARTKRPSDECYAEHIIEQGKQRMESGSAQMAARQQKANAATAAKAAKAAAVKEKKAVAAAEKAAVAAEKAARRQQRAEAAAMEAAAKAVRRAAAACQQQQQQQQPPEERCEGSRPRRAAALSNPHCKRPKY